MLGSRLQIEIREDLIAIEFNQIRGDILNLSDQFVSGICLKPKARNIRARYVPAPRGVILRNMNFEFHRIRHNGFHPAKVPLETADNALKSA
jgi:hypothetical protein